MIPVFHIILAFIMPAIVIYRHNKENSLKRPYVFTVISFVSCGIGIIMEVLTIKRRLYFSDIGGIEDTIGAVIIICVSMLFVTTILNLIALGLSYDKE